MVGGGWRRVYSVTVYTGDATGTGLVVVLGSETNKMAEGEGRVSHFVPKGTQRGDPFDLWGTTLCGEPRKTRWLLERKKSGKRGRRGLRVCFLGENIHFLV